MSPVVRHADALSAPRVAANRASRERTREHTRDARATRGRRKSVPGARKIVATLLPAFSRQLSAMLSAGMPIVTALDALGEQADNHNFKVVITQVRASIENGASLSESLQHFPSVFSTLYVNMVKGGETGGQLAETIGRLAGFLEETAKLRRKVRSAMMYPAIILCLSMAIAVAMVVFIVPVFANMYADFGAELPGPTRGLMNVSRFLRSYGLFLLIGIVAGVTVFKKWKASPSGRLSFGRMALRAPVFGELGRKVAAARFARTFGHLIKSGVPILNSLTIVSGATGNAVAEQVILQARDTVEKGDPLSSALTAQTVFPVMLVRMLQAGEKTGKVDEMMDRIADFYDDEVETMLAGLTSLLEPLLMVFLGVVIGGVVLCMFLPIFKMGEIVSQ